MTEAHRKLLDILKSHKRANPISRKGCMREWNNAPSHFIEPLKEKNLPQLKMELLTLYRQPIGSDQTGYWLAETAEDFEMARQYHHLKAMPHHKQEKILGEIFFETAGVQPKLL